MTQLEIWAKEYCERTGGENCSGSKCPVSKAYMAGYQDSSKRMHTPPEPCPPDHNCPDCGPSYIDESIYY